MKNISGLNFKYLFVVLLFVSLACTKNEEKPKQVEELTWSEVNGAVFEVDEGKRIEWHDEPENHLTNSDVVIENSNESCGGDNCGSLYQIRNINPDKAIKAIVTFSYDIEGDRSYFAREYEVPAGSILKMGCSSFCYLDVAYPLVPKVVDSIYME